MTTESAEGGLHATFSGIDADGDGRVDLVGFTLLLEKMGLSWARNETQSRFEEADTNRDGLISYPELRAIIDLYGWS